MMARKCKLSQHISIYCQYVSDIIFGGTTRTHPQPIDIVMLSF